MDTDLAFAILELIEADHHRTRLGQPHFGTTTECCVGACVFYRSISKRLEAEANAALEENARREAGGRKGKGGEGV